MGSISAGTDYSFCNDVAVVHHQPRSLIQRRAGVGDQHQLVWSKHRKHQWRITLTNGVVGVALPHPLRAAILRPWLRCPVEVHSYSDMLFKTCPVQLEQQPHPAIPSREGLGVRELGKKFVREAAPGGVEMEVEKTEGNH